LEGLLGFQHPLEVLVGGRLGPEVMRGALAAIEAVLDEMGVSDRSAAAA